MKKLSLRARVLGKAVIDWETSCWNWSAARDRDGYGRITIDNVGRKAHRVAYELIEGPIPEGLQLDHLCRNRTCINPAHLEPVTSRENTLRSPIALATICAAKTHCPAGHEYTAENTRMWKGLRRCRACGREAKERWRQANRERVRIQNAERMRRYRAAAKAASDA